MEQMPKTAWKLPRGLATAIAMSPLPAASRVGNTGGTVPAKGSEVACAGATYKSTTKTETKYIDF